jgi:hypothetical protein
MSKTNPATGRWLPLRFIVDCIECDCDIGEVLDWKGPGGRCLLESTPEQYAELKNRAEYYVGPGSPDQCPAGLKQSARAVLRHISAIAEACA